MENMAGKDKNTPFPTFFYPLLRFLYACRQIETAQLSASPHPSARVYDGMLTEGRQMAWRVQAVYGLFIVDWH